MRGIGCMTDRVTLVVKLKEVKASRMLGWWSVCALRMCRRVTALLVVSTILADQANHIRG